MTSRGKATAVAPSNIAFVKYWGKKDDALRLPLNSSFSMTTDAAHTVTTVSFDTSYKSDSFFYDQSGTAVPAPETETIRVIRHLDRIRASTGTGAHARVVTRNSFPKGTGAASSASGFAALTVAAVAAAGVSLPERDLTLLARQGSGSACRSIPDGFVEWVTGDTDAESFAVSLFPHTHWDLSDVLVVVSDEQKKVGSSAGMEGVKTSPFWPARERELPLTLHECVVAVRDRDIHRLGRCIEHEMFSMHAVMMTQDPPQPYWNDATMRVMERIRAWRREGNAAYYTIDAGPNVHLICETKDATAVADAVRAVPGVKQTIVSRICQGTKLTGTHLF